jgi:DNA-binding NarL/FixJ family response regulator
LGEDYLKVFIADDSEIIRERLKIMISEIGEVEIIGEADNVSEALNAIQRLKPDVVVLDIRMPGGSGIGLLKNIKNSEPAPMVIMLTDYSYPQYRKKCMDFGAEFFFEKSSEFEKVMEVFKQLIRSYP